MPGFRCCALAVQLGVLSAADVAAAQGAPAQRSAAGDPAARGTRLLRQPTVSSTQIAFVYAGDVWVVPRAGGDARRLTTSPGVESSPRFSPDGQLIAFSGEYAGNQDVYVVPAGGGEPRRLTWHPGPDVVRAWTPDGRRVVFGSGRAGAPVPVQKLWSIALDGGLPEALPLPTAQTAQHSPDGRQMAYQAVTQWDVEWRNYRGGQAQPIRVVSLGDLAVTKLPWGGSNDTDPAWLGDRVYFLSDRDGVTNVYAHTPGASGAVADVQRVTRFEDFDVKQLSGNAGALVFEQGGYVHLYEPGAAGGAGVARQVPIHVRGDLPWVRPQWKDVSRQILRGSLSPTGARAVFEARGEVFTVPVEKGDWRNLTRSPGVADRSPVWSPDGRQLAWFSDDGGEYALMIGTQDGVSPPRRLALPNPTFYFTPAWSPDSRRVAFTDEGLTLWYADVATGRVTKVDADQYMVPDRTLAPVWSPDSRWIAYAKRLPTQFHAVMVHSLADGRNHQLTDGLSDAVSPAWDASGRYLYFLASTNFALNTGWLEMSSYERPVTRAVYFAVLRADDASPLLPESDEERGPTPNAQRDTPPTPPPGRPDSAAAPAAARPRTGTGAPVSAQASDSARASAGAPVTVRVDLPNISQRILSLDVPARDYRELTAGAAGTVFFTEAVPNQPGLTLHRYDVKKRAAAPFLAGVLSFALSADGKKLLYQAPAAPAAQWGVVDAAAAAAKVGDGRLRAELRALVDPRAEWRQIFREAWRLQRDFFYVDNIHGANWDEVHRLYAPWVEHVGHRSDLSYLLDVLGGETAVGHSFVFGGDLPAVDTVPVGLLGADFAAENGRYRFARVYDGENWNPELRAPLSAPGVRVAAGEYLLAVNGVELRAPANPYALFEGTVGRQTVLRVGPRPTLEGSREITVVPIANEAALRSRAWVEDNRRLVDRLSNGRLAYVHLPNTANAGYSSFNRYYFAQQDKQGAVLDERFNGGGSAADYMIDVMRRRLFGYFNNPVGERRPFTTPQAGIWGPKVMIVNELAGSGGDLLPYMFRAAGLGPIVGTRTWGGLVGIWDTQTLVDGGAITNPRGGFFDLAGKWAVENEGVAPDIEVEVTPKDLAAGRDPQLERAVQEALKLLGSNATRLLTAEPAPPVRTPRAGGGGGAAAAVAGRLTCLALA